MSTHITTLAGLQAMKDNLSEDYILDNDIDASATAGWNWNPGPGIFNGFDPIGNPVTGPFTGTFDGQGHKITGLYVNRTNDLGLFGITDGADIKNVELIDERILSQPPVSSEVGGVAGYITNGTTITNCSVIGTIQALMSGAGASFAGGIVGLNAQGFVTRCSSRGSVSGTGNFVGGIAGENSGTILDCYSQMSVTGTSYVGGLVGINYGTMAIPVKNCYSTGLVTGGPWTGGLIGKNFGPAPVWSFWDTETSGQAASDGGIPKTTAQMNTKATFTDGGWDFTTIWDICDPPDYQPYPWLQWQDLPCELPPPPPTAPTDLLCEQKTNPTDVTDPKPEFSAIFHGG